MSEALRYVYGVFPASAGDAVTRAALRGLDTTAVRVVDEGALAAAVSDVDVAEYGAEGLNAKVADLDWLADRAAAHQDVNARILELADTLLPLAFGALYRDDGGVREMLREDADRRVARLRTLSGRGEWLVTIARDAGAAPLDDDGVRALDLEIAASAPGRAFLLERRRSAVATRAAERADAEIARDALARLEEAAERMYVEPVAAGAAEVIAARASLLAPRRGARALERVIDRIGADVARRGYRLRQSGPWPAYRFGALS